MDKIIADLKKTMVSAEHGWVMMVKTGLNADVYTPIVLEFDTLSNKVHITTVYGVKDEVDDFFRITKGTGSPQLIFTTGSIMTTLYRIGTQASDITDHMYNVRSVSENEIEIQPYRSGKVYAKEGGEIYKLFKRPADWTWADSTQIFDWTNPEFTNNLDNVEGEMTLEYLKTNTTVTKNWRFWSLPNPTIYRIRDPFSVSYNIGTGGFKPMDYFRVTGEVTNNVSTVVTNGYNAISFYPIPYNTSTNQAVIALGNTLKTHYLVFKNQTRNGRHVKLEFEAYDKDGKVIVKAFYDNKRN
ncbi:DUF4302 domain-containing protein [Sphingobacterium sp. Mn56C]|uniref:DUF4302 domain-containing protein n=1 Tax=Sphingobacterium sp. Mn56C TaxID=3395261 RepID=UPI003BD2E84A